MITIKSFWKVTDEINSKWGKQAYKYIDYCGVEPIKPLMNFGYFCTPKNSLTFATTGGNGVHFGILNSKKATGSNGPVVMTVPMAENNNLIIAEDLEEFFSLGYFAGWFAMEQLVYQLEDTIEYFSKPDPEISKKEQLFLEMLRKELPIKHRLLAKDRLEELKQKYFNQLQIDNAQEL